MFLLKCKNLTEQTHSSEPVRSTVSCAHDRLHKFKMFLLISVLILEARTLELFSSVAEVGNRFSCRCTRMHTHTHTHIAMLRFSYGRQAEGRDSTAEAQQSHSRGLALWHRRLKVEI